MKTLYERDFVAWTRENAELLRAGRFDELDVENVAEEIESLGKRDQRELKSRIAEIIEHLLKLKLPEFQRKPSELGGRESIAKQRSAVEQLLEESPSLRRLLTQEFLARCYAQGARHFAVADFERLAEPPKEPIFSWAEILEGKT